MGSRPPDMSAPEKFAHGTRARYVCGCRCGPCTASLAAAARERNRKIRDALADAKPNGPPLPGTLQRAGKTYQVQLCPGTQGRPCVKGGAWLKLRTPVCLACVERAFIWNGPVSAERARRHLLALSKKGIGKHAVAAASDVAHTILCHIKSGGKKFIRAATERRILAVDEAAIADHALVPIAPARRRLEQLLKRGFSRIWISRQLGYKGFASLLQSVQGRTRTTARNAANIDKLYRRVVEQKLKPPPFRNYVDARQPWKLVDELLEEGFTKAQLVERLGFGMHERRPKMRKKNADAIEQMHHQVFEAGELPRARFDPLDRKRLLDEFAEARNG